MSPRTVSSTGHREEGTASVELIAAVPFLLLAVLAAAQLALAGQALWSAGIAARAGARAGLVGKDAMAAARRALPPSLRRTAEVSESDGVSMFRSQFLLVDLEGPFAIGFSDAKTLKLHGRVG